MSSPSKPVTNIVPTPDLSHLNKKNYQNLYEPAEDTFLFLDALEKDSLFLERLKPSLCVEMGVGSGTVLTFLSFLLNELNVQSFLLGVDINIEAVHAAKNTSIVNHQFDYADFINTDLFSSLNLFAKVDLLLFNPPYVVTPSEEVNSSKLSAAWAGV
jgi:release factor glutamine methyltransferase